MEIRKILGINIIVLLCGATLGSAQSSHPSRPPGHCSPAPCWSKLTNTYPVKPQGAGAGPCLVLTDGTVACNNSQSDTNLWWRLTPDSSGDYLNGTWSAMPNMPYQPIFYGSAVLKDGTLLVQGGEYLNGNPTWTNQGAYFDGTSWHAILCNVIPSGQLGDAQTVIFPDGTFMIANITNSKVATLPANTNLASLNACAPTNTCYSLATSTGKDDRNDEEGWTLLPNGDILTVDAIGSPKSQTYNQSTGAWTARGNTGNCQMEDPSSQELGPQVLRPDGTVVVFGAATVTHPGACVEVYNTATNTWTDPGVTFPTGLDAADAPASLLPNGKVLANVSPGIFNPPSSFFEWDGASLTPVPGPPNAASDPSFVGHMVILPTGEIMFTDYSTDVELYTTTGTFQEAWRPVITGIPFLTNHPKLVVNSTYEIDGLQFNGLSQGAAYGDDLQTATNFPLVRGTQLFGAGNTVYFKTHDHSTMAVATGNTPVSTMFDVPATTPPGLYSLVVVANGIPSHPKIVNIGCTQQISTEAHSCNQTN